MPIDPQLTNDLKTLLAEGRHAQAIDRCQAALAEQPNDADLLTLLALAENESGQSEQALAHLEAAAAADAQHVAARFQLARLQITAGRGDQARERLTECLVLDPNHAGARTLLARLKAAGGQIDEARAAARTALRADPDHVPALVLLAELALESGDLSEASEQAARAVRLAPASVLAQSVMARVFEAQGHAGFAEQSLRNAVQSAPGAIAPARALAEFLDRQGSVDKAREQWQALIDEHPQRPDLRLALARVLRRAGQLDAALAEYEWLLDDGRDTPELVVETGECLARAGRGLEARSLIDRHALAQRDDARFLLARLDLNDGENEVARQALQALADAADRPVMERARLLLSDLALKQRDHHSALAALAPDEEDASPERVWQAAAIANQAGLVERERRWLNVLMERPSTPQALRRRVRPRLADLLDQAGDFQAAAACLDGPGWRAPITLADDAEAILDGALAAPSKGLPDSACDDDRRSPIVVLGWPGSGRETVLALLAASGQCRLAGAADWPERRSGLVQVLEHLEQGPPAAAARRLARRRYSRFAGEPLEARRIPVEEGILFAPELIAMARAFPDATMLRMRPTEDDLRLYWQLTGFDRVDDMLVAWRDDQAMIDRWLTAWGCEVHELPAADWLPPSQDGLEALNQALGLELDPALLAPGSKAMAPAGLRPAGHARHYPRASRAAVEATPSE